MGPPASHDPSNEDPRERLAVRLQRMRLEQSLFGRAKEIRVGRYTLREPLGAGGMGAVYLAYDESLDRPVALKVLNDQHADHPDASARMVREARAMARLSHPNVLTVHEVGVEDDQPYIVMELMSGGTLADWIQQHPPGEPGRDQAAVELLRQCTEGLLAAHEAGLVHRDFKPHNVLLTARGIAKVADFGLVRAPDDASDSGLSSDAFAGLDDGRTLTAADGAPGTPRYMAPEQREGIVDARSDQYSLCTTFLEVFEGSAPPRGIDALLRRGASEAVQDRFSDLQVLRAELDALIRPKRRVARWVTTALAILGVSAALILDQPLEAPPVEPCDDGRALLEPVWGEARRVEIRDAFERSGAPSWRHAWSGVERRLDDWTEAWTEARLDACEATQIRRVQSARMMTMRLACLDQRRATVQVLSDAWAAGEREVVDYALTTSHAMPRIEPCADREQLEYGPDDRGLDDPELRATYDRVGEARAYAELRRTGEAAALYAELEPELLRLGVPSLLSYVEQAHASLVLAQGDYARAEVLARQALDHAEQGGRDKDVLMAWLRMSMIARLQDQLDAAELYLERAENIATRHPKALVYQAEVARSRGDLESHRGNAAAALEAMDRAMAMIDEIGGSDVARMEVEHQTLGVLTLLGREDELERRGADLLVRARRTYGPEHRFTTMVASAIAQLYLRRGDWATVRALTRTAMKHSMSEHRADLVLPMRILYAISLQGLGLFEQAPRIIEEAIEEAIPILGPEHRQIQTARMQVGGMLIERGRYADALAQLRPIEDRVGTLHPINQCGFSTNLALAESGTGQHEAAVATMDRGLEICRARSAAKSVWLFTALRYAGEVYEAAERRNKARAVYREAKEISKTIQVAPPELAFVEAGLERLGGR